MDYTTKDGTFYKVIEKGVITSVGLITENNSLSTIHEVVFITEEEYKTFKDDTERD